MPNLIGQSLGRYHILEQLGEGGMATVYKAYDTRLERNVAIKVILPGKEHSDKFLKRFEREAKALAQLSHPNIVGVIDYGEQDSMPYLVMEYLPGGTLKHKLNGKPMPWQPAAQLLLPVARALAYAHSQKIIHRDVKPSNILITQSGEPMLSDFGIAKMLEAEETLDLTGAGVGVGTPEYMSPEQAQGKTVDGRSDIYSLGVVLYEMVTGRKPYQADTPMAVIFKLASEPLPRPKELMHDLPAQVENVLLKAMAKKPEDRFQDMTLFGNALQQLAQGMKLPAGELARATRPPRAQLPIQRRLWYGLAAGAVVIGLLVIAGGNMAGQVKMFSGKEAITGSMPPAAATVSATTDSVEATHAAFAPTATWLAKVRQQNKAHASTATAMAQAPMSTWVAQSLIDLPSAIIMPSDIGQLTVLYQAEFNSPTLANDWTLDSSARAANGILRMAGEDWQGNNRYANLADGEGVLLEYRCAPSSEAEIYLQSGDWNTKGMRRWGLYCEDPIPSSDIFYDYSLSIPLSWTGNLNTRSGSWYAVLLKIGGAKEFYGRVWDPAKPQYYREMRSALGKDWAGLKWWFAMHVNHGEIDIANYQEVKIP
jgi:hypothetical protein